MYLLKDVFIIFGLDIIWINEIEILFEEDFFFVMIYELKEKLKRGKGVVVKFK